MFKRQEKDPRISEFCRKTGKYSPDAYSFVTACVVKQVNELAKPRHLSALELLEGFKTELERSFGFLAQEILKTWFIKNASDVGEIVFDLIDLKILNASPEDRRSDFDIEFTLVNEPVRKRRKKTPEIPRID